MRLRLHTPTCPECGEPARGSSDFIPGIALFDGDPRSGRVDYVGETKVLWDGQFNAVELAASDSRALPLLKGVPREEQMQVQCRSGHEWITRFDTKE